MARTSLPSSILPKRGAPAATLQTVQRMGSACGFTIAGTLYFGALTASPGAFPTAASRALLGSTALVGAARIVGATDACWPDGGAGSPHPVRTGTTSLPTQVASDNTRRMSLRSWARRECQVTWD